MATFLPLVAAGAIYYLTLQSEHREEERQAEIAEEMMPHQMPTHMNIIIPRSGDKYVQELLRSQVPPAYVSYGANGIPQYYFPLPGGNGYYMLNHYDSIDI